MRNTSGSRSGLTTSFKQQRVDRNKALQWVQRHFSVETIYGDEASVLCPVHGDHNASMNINVAKGVAFCHACGAKGSLNSIARKAGFPPFTVGDDDNIADEVYGILNAYEELLSEAVVDQNTYLPDSTLRRYRFPFQYWTGPLESGGRDFSSETVGLFELGYDPLQDVAIIPIRDIDGNLLGVTRRVMNSEGGARYLDPKGFKKATNLYGAHLVANRDIDRLVLVEGPLDAVRVTQAGYNAVAQYGSNLTEQQRKLIELIAPRQLVLFYDNDAAGIKATDQALGVYDDEYVPEKDMRRVVLTRCVKYDAAQTKADPGGLTLDEIRRMVEEAPIVV